MSEDLRAKMEALRDIAPRLNRTTDQARDVIVATERFLNGIGIGVSALSPWFDDAPVRDDEDGGYPRSTRSHLAYGRLTGSYSIHVLRLTAHHDDPDLGPPPEEERVPWQSCPREVKLRSFAMLPDLLDQLLANATAIGEQAENAAGIVMGTLASLDGPPGPSSPARISDGGPGYRGQLRVRDGFVTVHDLADFLGMSSSALHKAIKSMGYKLDKMRARDHGDQAVSVLTEEQAEQFLAERRERMLS